MNYTDISIGTDYFIDTTTVALLKRAIVDYCRMTNQSTEYQLW